MSIDALMTKLCKKRLQLIFLGIFWLLLFTLKLPFENMDASFTENNGAVTGAMVELADGRVFVQPIMPSMEHLAEIQLKWYTYQRTNTSNVEISLVDGAGKNVAKETLNASELKDGYWRSFSVKSEMEGKIRAGEQYTLIITSPDAQSGNGVTVATSSAYNKDGHSALAYKLVYQDAFKQIRVIKPLLWGVLVLLSVICVLLVEHVGEKDFLLIALTIGSLYLFVNSFPHVIDEATHFFRSFAISKGELFDVWNNGTIGAYLPMDFPEVLNENKLDIVSLIKYWDFWSQPFSRETGFYSFPYMSSVIPTGHALAAIAIGITDCLGLSRFVVIWSARIMDYACYIALCYCAIKNANHYKSVFFIVSLLPTNIILAASCSQDPIVVGASLLFISLCLKNYCSDNREVSLHDRILLLICIVFFCSVKYFIYAPLLILLILIMDKLVVQKKGKGFIISAILIIGILLVLQVILMEKFPFKEDRNGDVDVARQITFVLTHLFYTYRNFGTYFENSIWTHLENLSSAGFITSAFPFIAKGVGIVGIIGGGVLAQDRFDFQDKKIKIAIFLGGVAALIYCLIIGALYVGFTPVGKFAVEGLQTRYILPFLPLVMIVLSMLKIENKMKGYESFLQLLMILGLLNTITGTMIYM